MQKISLRMLMTKDEVERTGVALAVSATVVELSSIVTLGDVDLGEVADTSDLDVFRSLDEVNALEGAIGHGASTTARLGAVGDGDAFHISNRAESGRSEQTEVGGGAAMNRNKS